MQAPTGNATDCCSRTSVMAVQWGSGGFINAHYLRKIQNDVDTTVLVQICYRWKQFTGCEFCRLAQEARTAAQITGAVVELLTSFPILN